MLTYFLSFRQVLGDGSAPEDHPVLWCSDGAASAAEVRRELGEEVRPLVSEDAGIGSELVAYKT